MDKLGFETILDISVLRASFVGISEENYCPDCYDCDYNCEECDNCDCNE
jgi:hypothetical protein